MTKIIDIATIDVKEGFDGSLDDLIDKLIDCREEAESARLVNVRVYTDYNDDDGKEWKLFIKGDERPPYVPKLPPVQHTRFFNMGAEAAVTNQPLPFGLESWSDVFIREAWQEGYDSIEK